MKQIPRLVLVCIAFAVGVGVATSHAIVPEWWLVLLVVSVGVGLLWRRNQGAMAAPKLMTLSLLLAACALGGLRAEWYGAQFDVSPLAAEVGSEVVLTGLVTREPDQRERNQLLYVATETDTVLVSVDRLANVSYGDTVTVSGTLREPEAFATDLGRTFDYPGYLLARGVEYRISFAELSVVESGGGNPVVSTLLRGKSWFIAELDARLPEPAVGLGKGLLLGVQSALGDQVEDDFRRTGLIHIVVLSGYNVMLVATFILLCLSFVLSFRWRIFAGISAIVAFALIVGLSATVVRASIMAVLLLIAQLTGRQYDVLRALFFAGAVMLIINPYLLIYDIGFQLSFMATLGLLLIAPRFEVAFMEQNKFTTSVREFFLATVATQIAVTPLLMYHIGQVSLIAVVANVAVLPLVPLAMLLTFLTGIVGAVVPFVGDMIGFLAWLSLTVILYSAEFLAALPFAAITVPAISSLVVFMLYGFIGAVLWWYREKEYGSRLSDWQIEEEAETQTAGEQSSPAEVPIFFR